MTRLGAWALPTLLLAACAAQEPAPAAVPAPVAAAPVASASAPEPASLVHVQVLAINDLHGNLEPPHGHDGSVVGPGGAQILAGGVAYLSAHIHKLAAENPNTVVVSAGDLTGASPLVSNLFDDEPTVLAMNMLGLDFEGVGNHDFDRGLTELRRLQSGGPAPAAGPGLATESTRAGALVARPPFGGARYHYLAANVLGPDGKTVFPAYEIRDVGGVKIAFVGMTLQGTPTVTTHEAIAGLTFANEAETANNLLPELRKQGVAATVLLIHQGGFQDEKGTYDSCSGLTGDILRVLKGLDPSFRVVVTAHTHQAYDCELDGRRVTSAGSYGRLITALDLAIDPQKATLVDVQAHNVPVTRDIEPDAQVLELVADYEAKASPVTERIVGYQLGALTRDPHTAHSPSCETPLGDLVADAELAATHGTGAELAFMNPGGVRTDLVPDVAGVAPVRYAAAFEVQPFGNRLITLSLTGAELHTLLDKQFRAERPRVLSVSKGFSYRYLLDKASHRVTVDAASMRLDGRPIDPKRTYRVTVNSFLAGGGDGFTLLRDAPGRVDGPLDIDALVALLNQRSSASHPVTTPKKLDRVFGNGCE